MAADEPSSQPATTSDPLPPPSTDTNTTKPTLSKPTLIHKSHSTTSAPTHALRRSSSSNLALVASPPLGQSPRNSRNTSPIRKDKPTSVSHTPSAQPSAAAIQRALSASNVTLLQYNAEAAAARQARAPRPSAIASDSPSLLPVSPRLRSPPPTGAALRRGLAGPVKKTETISSLNLPNSTPHPNGTTSGSTSPATSAPPTPRSIPSEQQLPADRPSQTHTSQPQPSQIPAASKVPSRGPNGKSTLETVQENSSDSILSPSPAAIQASADLRPLTKISDDEAREGAKSDADRNADRNAHPAESGNESAGNRSDNNTSRGRRPSAASVSSNLNTTRLRSAQPKASYSLTSPKARPTEGKNNMTVETETVQSIPQSALAAGDRSSSTRPDNGGSVRLKASNETIRPKKERKKADRKPRSVNQGTAASKADLFEARVASAVDEANDSDSDETFVYESNPPEQHRRQRHHSRTPSVTSAHSVAEQPRGVARSLVDSLDDRRVGGKRSMKFSRNPYTDIDSPDSNNSTVRSHTPRHIGRFGRGAGHTGHNTANFDHDTSHPQASRVRSTHSTGTHGRTRGTSPHNSPHAMHSRPAGLFGKKQEHSFDFDAEQNADDERQPLLSNSMRTVRASRAAHRYDDEMHPQEEYLFPNSHNNRLCGRRTTACLLTLFVVFLMLASAVGLLVSSNKPLLNVRIIKVENVLASEQELMLDLLVGAVNRNALAVTVGEMDLSVFAKSKYSAYVEEGLEVPTGLSNRQLRRARTNDEMPNDAAAISDPNSFKDPSGHWHRPGYDFPKEDIQQGWGPEKDSQAILLGRVQHFDQALLFEASPWKQVERRATGGLRLDEPGNTTEPDGVYHWDRVIKHPFELIVRGVLRYQLPISARMQNVAVSASVVVHPEDGIDRSGNMRVEPVDHSEHWQWIDWPDLLDDENSD